MASRVTNDIIKNTYDNSLALYKPLYKVMCITSLCPTSIHNAEYQNRNVESWNKLGLACFSLNCKEEQANISYPKNISVITEKKVNKEALERFHKYFVSIDTIFEIFRENRNKYDAFMLINSDIYLNYDPVYFDSLITLVKEKKFVFIRRYDYNVVNGAEEILGPSGGADIFLFHPSHLNFFDKNVGYLLGCPLFDGWIIDILLHKYPEVQTYYATSMFALHKIHSINWNRETFMFIRKITTQHTAAKFDSYYKQSLKYDMPSGMFVVPTTNEIWQYPCITEKQAFDSLVKLKERLPSNIRYYAINWATLLDKHNIPTVLTDNFIAKNKCPPNLIGVTVCQSIFFRKIIPYLKLLNITVLFTPHKIIRENVINGVTIKPFPLYAVNVEDKIQNKTIDYTLPKDIFFSFVGACSHKGHLSNIRTKIFELAKANLPNVVIKDTNNLWHFNTIVYGHQCKKSALDDKQLASYTDNTATYNNILCRSRYSLCPSGTGPNSLRFWESLAVGAIPVLLADTLDLPNVAEIKWENTIVMIKEKDYLNINNILKQISCTQEETYRCNCKKIYKLFSKDAFSEYIARELHAFKQIQTMHSAVYKHPSAAQESQNDITLNQTNVGKERKAKFVPAASNNIIIKATKYLTNQEKPNNITMEETNKPKEKSNKIIDLIKPAINVKSCRHIVIARQQTANTSAKKIIKCNIKNAFA